LALPLSRVITHFLERAAIPTHHVTAHAHAIEIRWQVAVTPDLQSGALFDRLALVSSSGAFGRIPSMGFLLLDTG
jgi:hypothetical protein